MSVAAWPEKRLRELHSEADLCAGLPTRLLFNEADNAMRVRTERSGNGIYLDIGELFVEESTRQSPKHVTARK